MPKSDPYTNVSVPDYTQECSVCGNKPVVLIKTKNGKLVSDMEMCGVCCFGEAACHDPANW